MAYTASHDLPPMKTGDTFKGENFRMSQVVSGNTSAMDLTDSRIRIDFRTGQTAPLLLRLTNFDTGDLLHPGGGIEITDAANGAWRIKPMIINLKPGTYMYDVEVTWPSTEEGVPDDIQTLIEGRWVISQDTTHD